MTTSLINKAIQKKHITISTINPRDFCQDKHKQVDDIVYGGGVGMLLKAEPVIQAVEHIIATIPTHESRKILAVSPSQEIFTQIHAHTYATEQDHLIFICGRYEGIDHRCHLYLQNTYPTQYAVLSLGTFVLMGGEIASCVMIEAIARLLPGVIKEEESWQGESYAIDHNMNNLEHPQYTRPVEVRGMKVPDVLISGHHKHIADRKTDNSDQIDNQKV